MRRQTTRDLRTVAVIAMAFVAVGCAMDGEGMRSDAATDAARGPDGANRDAAADGSRDGSTGGDGAPVGDGSIPGCTMLRLTAESTRRPIDIIIWVDDGGSFDGARGKVSRSINTNLVGILDAAGVDYQVILLSAGTTIGAPLNPSMRFYRVPGGYSAGGGGYAFFSAAQYLRLYCDRLRDGAFRVFLSATDCENEAGTFAAFEAALAMNCPARFTVGPMRNFVYNMIGNVALRTPNTQPWFAMDGMAGRGSYAGFTACTNTQRGAIETGGLRLGVAAPDYDALFREIANASVRQARLPCSFAPPTDRGMDLDLTRVRFRYQPGDGSPERVYRQVPDAAACTAGDGGFYTSMGRLELCPSTCDAVRMDAAATVTFTFECIAG